jgi:hypothetical protein
MASSHQSSAPPGCPPRLLPDPAQRRGMADLLLFGRFGAAHAIRNRPDTAFPQIK